MLLHLFIHLEMFHLFHLLLEILPESKPNVDKKSSKNKKRKSKTVRRKKGNRGIKMWRNMWSMWQAAPWVRWKLSCIFAETEGKQALCFLIYLFQSVLWLCAKHQQHGEDVWTPGGVCDGIKEHKYLEN